jgi:hypothetical protein
MKPQLRIILFLSIVLSLSPVFADDKSDPSDADAVRTAQPEDTEAAKDQQTDDSGENNVQEESGDSDDGIAETEYSKNNPSGRLDAKKDKPFILKFGVESMSRTSSISGGSYLYTEFVGRIAEGFSVSMKYSSSIVPTSQDNCLFGSMIFRLFSYDNGYEGYFSPLYMTNLTPPDSGARDNHVGGKLCLFAQNDNSESIYFELLPFTLLYNINTRDISYSFEFLTIGIKF